MSEYEKMAKDFLKRNGATCTITFKEVVVNPWNAKGYTSTWAHNRYRVRIDRNHKTYSYLFTDSYKNYTEGKRPTAYDVLSCLTIYEPESNVWDFAQEFGYEICDKESYKRVEKIHKAVCKEYRNVMRLFGDVIEELAEIN